tara:strand:- start:1282 stop:1953 length:672 start_codon:yes stop_codon:yes gene_type:complete
MSVRDDNVIDMEKEHMKKVILDLSRKHGISPSQLAQEAGIAPSTITGFLNDREGRAKHGLSAQTQNKLEKTYPEFNEAFDIPKQNDLVSLPVIGNWASDYTVRSIHPGMPSQIATNNYKGYENRSAVCEVSSNNTLNKINPNLRFSNFRKDNKFYIFKNQFMKDLSHANGRLVYAKSSDDRRWMGICSFYKGKFCLFGYDSKIIHDCDEIVGATLIDWCLFAP